MSGNKILTIVLVLLLVTVLFTIVKYAVNGNKILVSPGTGKVNSQTAVAPGASASVPQTPSFNPPKEIKYGSATDLKQELESINPQVLDSDF